MVMLWVGMWLCLWMMQSSGWGSSDGMAEKATLPSLLSVLPSGGMGNGDGNLFFISVPCSERWAIKS